MPQNFFSTAEKIFATKIHNFEEVVNFSQGTAKFSQICKNCEIFTKIFEN